jgi:hypothetical protein
MSPLRCNLKRSPGFDFSIASKKNKVGKTEQSFKIIDAENKEFKVKYLRPLLAKQFNSFPYQ